MTDREASPTFRSSQAVGSARRGRAASSVGLGRNWRSALDMALGGIGESQPDAIVLCASAHYGEDLAAISEAVWHHGGSMIVVGGASSGVIGRGAEIEAEPAISLLALELPGAVLRPVRVTQAMLEATDGDGFSDRVGVDPALVNGWLIFADPFRMDGALLMDRMGSAYPGLPAVGGLLAPGPAQRQTTVFLNGQTYDDGGVGLSIGGAFDLLPVVSQGCEPIGEPWTITGASGKWVETIANRPALHVLTDTLGALPEPTKRDAHRNLVAGLAANEYRETFDRGDFLIRNIVGIDRESGAIALGARPRVGQTIQFQLRDAATATLDLVATLLEAQIRLDGREAIGAVMATCNGRGTTLFGEPHHDAGLIERRFPGLPVTGLIAAGEIGPVGSKTFIHGFSSCLGMIVPA